MRNCRPRYAAGYGYTSSWNWPRTVRHGDADGHTGRALPMLATAMLRDSELGHAAICLVSYLWLWATVHTMGRLMGILAGLHLCEFASRDAEYRIPTCPFRLEFSSRMGYRPGHALYRYACDPICPVCQLTLIDTHISTDVRCMPIEAARLAPGSELYPNDQLDLCRVDWDEWPMCPGSELASNGNLALCRIERTIVY